mgnify:CR=1 FL=1
MKSAHLVHTGIGKQKGRVLVRDCARGRHKCVPMLLEVVDKRRSDLVRGPVTEFRLGAGIHAELRCSGGHLVKDLSGIPVQPR